MLHLAEMEGIQDMHGHWINNQRLVGDSQEVIETQNPATEELLDRVPAGTEKDAHVAIESSRVAFEEWRRTHRL